MKKILLAKISLNLGVNELILKYKSSNLVELFLIFLSAFVGEILSFSEDLV